MKKTLLCLALGVLTLSPTLYAQSAGSTGITRERSRSSYDPGFAASSAARQQVGPVDAVTNTVNPCHQNYGFWLDQAHIEFYGETLHDWIWNGLAASLFAMMLLLTYCGYLTYREDLLLDMASNMIAQLYNAHCDACLDINESVKQYNALMRRFNAHVEAEMEAKRIAEKQVELLSVQAREGISKTMLTAAAQIPGPLAEQQTALLPAIATVPVIAADSGLKKAGRPKASEDSNNMTTGLFEGLDDTIAQTPELPEVEQLRLELQKMKHKCKAQEDKVTSLRAQVNRAHQQLVSGQSPQQGDK